jgi:3-methyladenine DNA glycosylase AlkD
MNTDILLNIRKTLISSADEKTKNSFQRFFKSEVKCYGVKSAQVGKINKQFLKETESLNKEEVFQLCEELYKSDYEEEAWVAANLAHGMCKEFIKSDFKIFEKWIDQYINDWAKCDGFCNHTVWALIEMYPELIQGLITWAKSKNLWLRRASAVTLIIPAKEGKYLNEIFKIADLLLKDDKDMVQKGYGWMLKEASRLHQKEVFDYIVKNKAAMPRTALRYAIEKMPEELRKRAMEK